MKRKRTKARSPDELVEAAAALAQRGELAEAEARYREALALAPDHLGVLTLLGLLLVERGDADGAIDMLERVRDAMPEFAPGQLALGSAYAAAGHDELAVAAMEAAIRIDTTSTLPLERLAKHHIAARRPREAIGMLRRILRRDASHAQAQFLLAGLTNDTTATRSAAPPAEWISDLFDTYSGKFEQHLVEHLHYSVPRSLAELVAALRAPDASWRVLDLGCGTGLAGAQFKPYARELIGVDLSPRMITRARQRAIYDQLHCESLAATLARSRDVDLIIAADVFIYVGALEATFAACATALAAGGMLAFSVERSDHDDVVLQPSLRYAHSDPYIRQLASEHGLAVERAEASVLRIEDGQPIGGTLYLLRR